MKRICLLIPILFLLCGCKANKESVSFFSMDTVMNITAYTSDKEILNEARKEIENLSKKLDRNDINSTIFKINTEKNTSIDNETINLLKTAYDISKRTDGEFDITIAPIMDLWGFYDKNYYKPTDEEIKKELKKVDYKNIEFGENEVKISPHTTLDLGGIAKGYAAEKTAELLKSKGIDNAILSLGGNICALGDNNGDGWNVAIQSPDKNDEYIGTVNVSDKSVVTSGGYERFFEADGKIYHHIIDTKSGYSAQSGLKSVTVISDSSTLCDALSTAIYVMGKDEGIVHWENYRDFDMILVDDENRIYVTDGVNFKSSKAYEIIK